MATISKSANYRFYINGQRVNAPVGWKSLEVSLIRDKAESEANITTERFEFVGLARKLIIEWAQGGVTGTSVGITEGIPFRIAATNKDSSIDVFDGFINLMDEGYEIDDRNQRVFANVSRPDNVLRLEDRLEGITFDLLESSGIIGQNDYVDVPYVVEPFDQPIRAFQATIVGLIAIKELAQTVKDTGDTTATSSGITASGITGVAGSVVYLAIRIVVILIYIASIISSIILMGRAVLDTFFPAVRNHKGATLRTLLKAVTDFLGFELDSDIEDLDRYVYIPPNETLDKFGSNGFLSRPNGTRSGIPTASTAQFSALDYVSTLQNMFNARLVLIGNTLFFRVKDSDFFENTATYILPATAEPKRGIFTESFKAIRQIKLLTDSSDLYTLSETSGQDFFLGTNVTIQTKQIRTENESAVFINGIEPITIPMALGARRESRGTIEELFRPLLNIISNLTAVLGNPLSLRERGEPPIGALRVSDNNHFVPKVVVLQNGRIPQNHRSLLSARYLWETYHRKEKSVVKENDYRGQKERFNNIRVPFGLGDFNKILNNDFFTTVDGKKGKILRLNWNLAGDYADIDYWVREILTTNVEENVIEG